MSLNTRISNLGVNTEADALCALLDNGYLRIYSGTQPADADTALSGNTLLAELRFGTPAFAAAVLGVATANAITSDASANASGTATFFRCLKADGSTVIWDGSVGTSDANLIVVTTTLTAGNVVDVTSLLYTAQKN